MQQTTINLPSTNPVRALTGLARQIALPGEYAPERFPSFPALERTAVMAFTQPTTWSVPAGTTYHGMLCRQAAYPYWLDQVQPYGAGYRATYLAVWGSTSVANTSAVNSYFDFKDAPLYAQAVGPVASVPTLPGVVSDTGLFGMGSALLAVDQECGSQPFMYVPPGAYCYVIVSGSTAFTATNNFEVTLDKWRAPGLVEQVPTEQFSGTSGTTGAMSGNQSLGGYWVRPTACSWTGSSVTNSAATVYVSVLVSNSSGNYAGEAAKGGTVTINASGASITTMMPATLPTEFATSTLPWSDTRLTAAAVLMTNVTQVLNKNGTVMAGRISPNSVSPWLVTKANVQALHPAEKAFLPLETGLYTYCPPSTDMSNFWDYVQYTAFPYTGYSKYVPLYRLDNTSLVNHFFLDSTVASSFACSVSWHVEFRTSSALFQIALSGLTLEALHGAQLALATAGFFFENPEHDSVLSKVIAGAKKIAPHLMSVAEMHPAGKAVVSVAKALSGPRKVTVPSGSTKVKPTSSEGSGITSKKPKPKGKKGQNKKK